MRTKWVFNELVSSDDDVEGLVAYGIYKYKKYQNAVTLNKAGKTPDEINQKLDDFHDQFIGNNYEQTKLIIDATIILNGMREKARENLAAEHRKEIEKITKQHKEEIEKLKKEEAKRQKNAIKKDRDEWIAKVDKTQLANHNLPTRLFLFAWSGVPSALATFAGYLLFTFLLISVFTKQEDREAKYNEATEEGKRFFKIEQSKSSSSSAQINTEKSK